MMTLVSQEGFFAAVEQRRRILGDRGVSVTLQESHTVFPLLWSRTSPYIGASRAVLRLYNVKNGHLTEWF